MRAGKKVLLITTVGTVLLVKTVDVVLYCYGLVWFCLLCFVLIEYASFVESDRRDFA